MNAVLMMMMMMHTPVAFSDVSILRREEEMSLSNDVGIRTSPLDWCRP